MRTAVVLLLLSEFIVGTHSTVERRGPPLPPREKGCQLEFLDAQSARPRDVIGVVQVWVRKENFTLGPQAVYKEAMPEMRKQACKLGAEGVVVLRQTVSSSGEFKLLYVKAEAVRFPAKE